jgi:TRAP-type C4-dicarboxylate transport system permease small subunit
VTTDAQAGADQLVERWLHRLGHGLLVLAGLANLAIFVVVLLAVGMRYVVGSPLPETEELSGLLLAMSVFLVMPLTIIANLNIRVTLITERLAGAARRISWIVGELVLIAFLVVFARESWIFYTTALRFREKSEQAQLVLAPWKLAAFVILAVCVICALWRAWRPPPKTGGTVI